MSRGSNLTIAPTPPPAGFDVSIDPSPLSIGVETVYMGIIYALSVDAPQSPYSTLTRNYWKDPHRATAELRYLNVHGRTKYKHFVWSLQETTWWIYEGRSAWMCTFAVEVDGENYGRGWISPRTSNEANVTKSALSTAISDNNLQGLSVGALHGDMVSVKPSGFYRALGSRQLTNLTVFPTFTHRFIPPYTPVSSQASLWVFIEALSRHAFKSADSLVDSYTIRDPSNLVELIIVGGQELTPLRSCNDYFIRAFKWLAALLYSLKRWDEVVVSIHIYGMSVGGFTLRKVQRALLASGDE